MKTMQKSKNNGVDPLELVEKHGADVTRLAVLFAAPAEKPLEWDNERSVRGCARWLNRLRANLPCSEELEQCDSSSRHDILDAYETSRDTIDSVTKIMTEEEVSTLQLRADETFQYAGVKIINRSSRDYEALLFFSHLAPEITSELWQDIDFTRIHSRVRFASSVLEARRVLGR